MLFWTSSPLIFAHKRSLTYCHTSENNSKISWHKIVPLVPELSHVRNVLRNSENLFLAPIVIFFKLSGVFDEKQLCYFLLCNHFLLNYFPQNRPKKVNTLIPVIPLIPAIPLIPLIPCMHNSCVSRLCDNDSCYFVRLLKHLTPKMCIVSIISNCLIF